ncbi:hypothetical protein OJF2_51260 [Aquisphaera giovannonii]|uniref:Uncharacterized protein n=1 Tax=Aquisphaera giovannonii TaxID=406548 RepID=A0A5B9W790_9BACT|nr:hypothetical protein [Aquisphaera giovannonii]QEH36542.1 hypothetical protein OJF2_51260 [Aquisphaera giovannonii]
MTHTAKFTTEDKPSGTVYYPADRLAVELAGVAGCRAIPEERMPYIRSLGRTLGFQITLLNGEPLPPKPIPHPRPRLDVEA